MKKLFMLSLVLGVGVQIGRTLEGIPKAAAAGAGQAGGAETCTAKNGDVNADGKVDLSDAVTILGHLFLGNPGQLSPLCEVKAPSAGVPATGQTQCYDESGTELACDSATCPGQDGFHATGCPTGGRFVDNGDGTVTDNCTGLMWQKDTADVNGDGQTDMNDRLPWCDALAHCENLSFAGHDDWRLPNVRELDSLVDYGRVGPAIDPVFAALSFVYWSSTSVPGPAFAWQVHFGSGDRGPGVKGADGNVRAVRNAP